MSGRVRCGGCGKPMSIDQNGKGQHQYKCKNRGESCGMGSRSNKGIARAAVHALGLLRDPELQDAIRRHLGERRQPDAVRRRRTPGSADALAALRTEQDMLLQLFYKDHIDETLFAREQARIRQEIENHSADAQAAASAAVESVDLAARFEDVLAVLEELNIADLWPYATDSEKRILLGELVQHVEIHADRLTVHIHGAPPLNVDPSEVGLKGSGLRRVGGGT